MRWVRSTYFVRLIAGVLVASMLPALIGPASQASAFSLQGSYEVWIRAQLRTPADEVVEEALDRVSEESTSTISEYVSAFVEALAALDPGTSAAKIFTDQKLTDEALIAYLQRRYTEIAPEAVVPRLRPMAAPVASSLMSMGSAATIVPATTFDSFLNSLVVQKRATEHVLPLRILSSARSQGP